MVNRMQNLHEENGVRNIHQNLHKCLNECDYIFVDLDGTLIKQNASFELFRKLCVRKPFAALKIQFNYLFGRKNLNHDILGDHVEYLNCFQLLFHKNLIDLFKSYSNKKIVLATGSSIHIAHKINKHIDGLFYDVIGSQYGFRCVAENKLRAIHNFIYCDYYSNTNKIHNCNYASDNDECSDFMNIVNNFKFAYLGNSAQDIPVWKKANYAGIVESESFLAKDQPINFDMIFDKY